MRSLRRAMQRHAAAGCAAIARAEGSCLGEIMSFTQLGHLKLCFAGGAGECALAAYEVDELEEGFADVVRFQPEHPVAPGPLGEDCNDRHAAASLAFDRIVRPSFAAP